MTVMVCNIEKEGVEEPAGFYPELVEGLKDELATLRARLTKEQERFKHECESRDRAEEELKEVRAALAEMTERARKLGEAVLKAHVVAMCDHCQRFDKDNNECGGVGNIEPCPPCDCPACQIAQQIKKASG